MAIRNIYIDSVNGSDANNGTSESFPIKTTSKANTIISGLLSADYAHVFLKRGQNFRGTLNPSKLGIDNTQRFRLDAYGTGDKPVMNGGLSIKSLSWTQYTANKWKATLNETPSLLYKDGNLMTRARDDNNGKYYEVTQNSATSSNQVVIGGLNKSAAQMAGTRYYGRHVQWEYDTRRVDTWDNSTKTLTVMGTIDGLGITNFRYNPRTHDLVYFDNHIDFLTKQDYWFYDELAKEIHIYSTTNPNTFSTLECSVDKYGVFMDFGTSKKYGADIQNIHFRNYARDGIRMHGYYGFVTIANNDFNNIRKESIRIKSTNGSVLSNDVWIHHNNVNNCCMNGIYVRDVNNLTIEHNDIKNVALALYGLWDDLHNDYGASGNGIRCEVYNQENGAIAKGINVRRNKIDKCYQGVHCDGDTIDIGYNEITNFCWGSDDYGGIYAWANPNAVTNNQRGLNKIHHNFISGGYKYSPAEHIIFNRENNPIKNGIYLDQGSHDWEVYNNVVEDAIAGMMVNYDTRDINIHDNVFLGRDFGLVLRNNFRYNYQRFTVKNNTIVCLTSFTIPIEWHYQPDPAVNPHGTIIDGNRYMMLFNNSPFKFTVQGKNGYPTSDRVFSDYGFEQNGVFDSRHFNHSNEYAPTVHSLIKEWNMTDGSTQGFVADSGNITASSDAASPLGGTAMKLTLGTSGYWRFSYSGTGPFAYEQMYKISARIYSDKRVTIYTKPNGDIRGGRYEVRPNQPLDIVYYHWQNSSWYRYNGSTIGFIFDIYRNGHTSGNVWIDKVKIESVNITPNDLTYAKLLNGYPVKPAATYSLGVTHEGVLRDYTSVNIKEGDSYITAELAGTKMVFLNESLVLTGSAPVITLVGGKVTLTKGEPYGEPGYSAFDNEDGNIPVTVSGTVDVNTAGLYVLFYDAVDSNGNAVTATREVQVNELSTYTDYSQTGTTIDEGSGPYGGYADRAAYAAFDKDMATFYDPVASTNTYVGRDMGSAVTLNKLTVDPRPMAALRVNNAILQYSSNNVDWLNAVTVTGIVNNDDIAQRTFTFADTSARYWRLFSSGKLNVIEIGLIYEGEGGTGTGPNISTTALIEFGWSGAIFHDSFSVKSRLLNAGTARLAVSTSSSFTNALYSPYVTANADKMVSLTISGLTPSTTYYWGVEVDGVIDGVKSGKAKTLFNTAGNFKVTASSCAYLTNTNVSNHTVWDRMRELHSDSLMFLHMGDLHYRDIGTNDPQLFRDAYQWVMAQSRQNAFFRSTPTTYVWDDHDFGPNNSDSSNPAKAAAMQAFREYVPHYPLVANTADSAIGQTFVIGRVRFIVLDPRSYKSAPTTMLGTAQKAWLFNLLETAPEKVIGISTGMPWVADGSVNTDATDSWASCPNERDEIGAKIVSTGRNGKVFMMAGDAHMIALDDGANNTYGGMIGVPMLQLAALSSGGSIKGGPYNLTPTPFQGPGQFGTLEFADTGGDSITMTVKGYKDNGTGLDQLITWQKIFDVSVPVAASQVTVSPVFSNIVHATTSVAGELTATSGGNASTEGEGANFTPVLAGSDYHVTWIFENTATTYNVDFHAEKGKLDLASALFGISVRDQGLFKIVNGSLTYVANIAAATHLRISVLAAENGGMPVLKWSTDNKATWNSHILSQNWELPLIGAVRFKENTARVTGLEVYYNTTHKVGPAVLKPLPAASAVETVELIYTVPNDTFTDLDGNASDLTLSASGMPAWMTFTQNGSGGGSLQGTPPSGTAGSFVDINIKATDLDANFVIETIRLTVYDVSVIDVIGFTVNTQTPQIGQFVTFTPLKTAGFTKFHWEIPGSGTPEVDGNSPTVQYSATGQQKVVMYAVIDANNSIKIEKPYDYITVFPNLSAVDHYIDIEAGVRKTVDNNVLGVTAGQVVCLRNTGIGAPGSLYLKNFVGNENNPIWFTNQAGVQAEISYSTNDGIKWEHCRHIRESYVNGIKYGLYIESTSSVDGGPQGHSILGNAFNHRTYGIEQGRHGFAAFMSKNDPGMYLGAYDRPSGFTMWGRWLKHCKVDSNGNRISGLGRAGHEHVYFGHFRLEEAEGSSHYMPDVQVAYNNFKDAGRDNIQVCCVGPTQDAIIHDNICDGAGLDNISSQRQNLALNEGFGGWVYGNICKRAAEQFMDLHPYGDTYIFNNVFEKHGYIRTEQSSFNGWLDGTGTAKTIDCSLYFFNNTVINIANAGGVQGVVLRMYEALGDPFTDVFVDNNAFTYTNSGNVIATTINPRVGLNNKGRQLANSAELGMISHSNNQRLLPGSILRSGGTDMSALAWVPKVLLRDLDGYNYPPKSGAWFVGAYYDTQQANYGATSDSAPEIISGLAKFRHGIFGVAGRI